MDNNDGGADSGAPKENLLLLCQRIPYPPTKGDKITVYHLVQWLRARYRVFLGCLVDDPDDLQHIGTVRAWCADAHIGPLDRRRATIASLAGFVKGTPLSFEFYQDHDLQSWVDTTLQSVRLSAVIIYSSNMVPYVLDRMPVPLRPIVFFADVDSEKWRAYALRRRWPMRWVYRREAVKVLKAERLASSRASACLFISEKEGALFRTLVPDTAAKVFAVSNGVDSAYFNPDRDYPSLYNTNVPNFVFTGAMDYQPNIDAVLWFANDILPHVQARLPSAVFHIVGSNPARAVLKMHTRTGIEVTGRVPDVRPYLAHATAAVAPLRLARGLQNKVLEAMAMARPVIVTPDALEGIDAVPGRDLVVAADAPSFAAACIAAAADAARGRSLGVAARALVCQAYSWPARLEGLAPILGLAASGSRV